MPRVSIVVPNWNYAQYLDERIQSLLRQTYHDLELIIVDDASTDGSRAVIARYAADPRVRTCFFDQNSGSVYQRWNDGARLAQGEYLLIAGADDSCEPTLLEKLAARLDEHPTAGMAHCHSLTIDEDGVATDNTARWAATIDPQRWTADHVDVGRHACQYLIQSDAAIPTASAVLMRRQVFEKVGGFDLSLTFAADYLMWARMMLAADVAFVAEPLNLWRWHDQSVTWKFVGERRHGLRDLEESFQVVLYLLDRLVLPHEVLQTARKRWIDLWLKTVEEVQPAIPLLRQRTLFRLARRLDPGLERRLRQRLLTQSEELKERCRQLQGQVDTLQAAATELLSQVGQVEATYAPFTYLSGALRQLPGLTWQAIRKRLPSSG